MQPPNSPEGFPNYNDPLPPTPGYNPTPYGGPPPNRRRELSFDYISEAWTYLQPHIGSYIGALLLAIMAILVAAIPSGIIESQFQNGNYPSAVLILLALIFRVVSYVVGQIITAGLYRMAINHLRRGRPEIMDVFSTFDVALPVVIAGILNTIGVLAGYCLCLIPGLLLGGLWMFTVPLIVDKKLGPLEAMSTSFNALKDQMWMALAFVFVVGLLASAGALACCLGILVTAPLALLTFAVAYRNFFITDAPETGNTVYGAPPIANPGA